MIKKALLVAGSLLLGLAGLLLYGHFAAPANPADGPAAPGVEPQPITGELRGMGMGAARDVTFYFMDDTGRREGTLTVAEFEKVGEEFFGQDVRVELYPANGETVTITAREGTITADEAAGQLNPRRGTFTGDVHIAIDRQVDVPLIHRTPRQGRPDDFIDVRTQQLRFDNELLELQAPGEVEVVSREATIEGADVTIQWNTGPNELRSLRMEQGRRMVIRQAQTELVPERAQPRPDGGEPAPAGSTQPATTTAPERPRSYQVTLRQNVCVDGPDQRLENADELAIAFYYDTGEDDPAEALQAARPDAPADSADPGPQTDQTPPVEAPAGPIVVTWDGPLVMLPLRGEQALAEEQVLVEATGKPLTILDRQTTATAGRLVYDRRPGAGGLQRQAHLYGLNGAPAELALESGQVLRGQAIHFDQQAGRAWSDGPGEILLPADGALAQPGPAPADRIAWTESMQASFTQVPDPEAPGQSRRVLDEATFVGDVAVTMGPDSLQAQRVVAAMAPGPGGRPVLTHVEAFAQATPEASAEPAADLSAQFSDFAIDTQRLAVQFAAAPGAGGQTDVEPRQIDADGGVRVTVRSPDQPPMTITGQALTARPLADAPAGADGERPMEVIVTGSADRPAEVTAAARSEQGGFESLTGQAIRLVQGPGEGADALQGLWVQGRGQLKFSAVRSEQQGPADLRPVTIGWTQGATVLDPAGANDQAVFTGDVRLTSGDETLHAQRMVVELERSGEGSPGLEDLRVRQVRAEGQPPQPVRLDSRQLDPAGRLIRGTYVAGPGMVCTLDESMELTEARVDGTGRLLTVDYRLGSPDGADAPEPTGLDAQDGPSQTVLAWREGLVLQPARADRAGRVEVAGAVSMVRLSGNRILTGVSTGEPIPLDLAELKEGRKVTLACQNLAMFFGADEAGAAGAEGPADPLQTDLGTVETVAAVGDVRLIVSDGPVEIHGQYAAYDPRLRRAEVYGSAPAGLGERFAAFPLQLAEPVPGQSARLYQEDPARGQSTSTAAERFTVYTDPLRVEVHNAVGTGRR